MDLGLSGKTAIVTGGSRGIGRACAIELAREGANVLAVALHEEGLRSAVAAIDAAGPGRVASVAVDLSSEEGCRAAVTACLRDFEGVDVLINCAGGARGGPVLDISTELIDDALALKLYGYLRMAQLTVPHMRERGWGRIVNIAGGAGANPTADNLPVSLTNIGVLNMTRSLSDATAGDGILVNTICPGITDTDRARGGQQARAEREGRPIEELLDEAGKGLPAGVSRSRRRSRASPRSSPPTRAATCTAARSTWTAARGAGRRSGARLACSTRCRASRPL